MSLVDETKESLTDETYRQMCEHLRDVHDHAIRKYKAKFLFVHNLVDSGEESIKVCTTRHYEVKHIYLSDKQAERARDIMEDPTTDFDDWYEYLKDKSIMDIAFRAYKKVFVNGSSLDIFYYGDLVEMMTLELDGDS